MSTPVFVDPEISTQADKAQSSRVPIPLPEDPYEAIRQVYLDGTDTESEPIEDPVETETPESPLVVAPPTSLPKSTLPTLVYILRRTARIVVCVPPAMSPGLSASMAEVAAMSESVFRKSKEDDDEEDEEIEESLDSDSVSEDAEDKGPTTEDEDPAAGDQRLVAGDEGPDMNNKSHGMDDESHGMDDESHGLDDETPPVQTPPSPKWTSCSLPISPSPSIVPSPVSSPMIPLTVPSPVATPATAETKGFLTKLYDKDIEDLFIRSGAVRDEIFSQRNRFRSLEYENERVTVTFGAIWIPGENRDLQLQLAEERRARLKLSEVVNSMRRGQEPRGEA
ncbi:hypothetical protein Tco_0309161 [Tanacetum coccineum]